jgi:urea transport system permease protein
MRVAPRAPTSWPRSLALASLLLLAASATARAQSLGSLATQLGSEDHKLVQSAIIELGARHEPAALTILQALEQEKLRLSPTGQVLVLDPARSSAVDAITGQAVKATSDLRAPLVTNTVRRALQTSIAGLELRSRDKDLRAQAAKVLAEDPPPELTKVIREAVRTESDSAIRKQLALALAQLDLQSTNPGLRLAAVRAVGALAEPSLKPQLQHMLERQSDGRYGEPDAQVRKAAGVAMAAVQRKELFVRIARDLFYGLSLGSVLLLAALGLAITFGLMGVINMAHGEMLMLGAYATYVVQRVFEQHFPGAMNYYLAAAVPVAFGACMLIGMLLERTVIRFLYGRPLETLLATFGISLLLIQTVRLIFGAQNVTVANPAWLSGGLELMPDVVLPYTRLATIVFVAVVVAFVWYLLNRTTLGLQVRAITQNRRMARCVGIRTSRVDTLTFGLGSAVAGLGGVALSQIGNVGPELGQSYIVDSFMVVVVGGVGSLFGTLFAALGLGTVNKLLEPVSGAVLGKILVLGFIILFIQRRPQGLFALKGRAAES